MTKKIAPSEVQAQELAALLQGHTEVHSGEEGLSTLVQLATERVLQDARKREQTALLGRHRYERCGACRNSRMQIINATSFTVISGQKASSRAFLVTKSPTPIDATLRQQMIAWEAANLPAKGLARVLH
jgi:hypothetical protein